MEPPLLMLFQHQVQLQCRFILWADEALESAIKRRQPAEAFCALQGLLNAAANIRKALWGKGDDLKLRKLRKPLRDSLEVNDDSPLIDVRMRNRFEHFDEDLADWYKKRGGVTGYADLNVGLVFDFDKRDVFRSYNPKTRILTFLERDFNVHDVVGEAKRLLEKSTQELQQHLPPSLHPVVASGRARGVGTGA